jgi:hypothetical protein
MYAISLHVCSTSMLTFQALANSRFFRHHCGFNTSCRPHVLQTDLFLKMYSSIWLSQNFLGYNSIERFKRCHFHFFFFFMDDCGIDISCRLHVLHTALFLKIYSSIWLYQNFWSYNSITNNNNKHTYSWRNACNKQAKNRNLEHKWKIYNSVARYHRLQYHTLDTIEKMLYQFWWSYIVFLWRSLKLAQYNANYVYILQVVYWNRLYNYKITHC